VRPAPEVHDALACLLTYPGGPAGEGGVMTYPVAAKLVARACPEVAADLRAFSEGIRGLDAGELEELYTRTFDNVADRSLEVGWQLFGENYARGVLMVRFRALMREYDVPEHTELPDHLTHVLALLARAPERKASAFACHQVLQAVEKMLEGVRSYESPWVGVLEATRKVLLMHQPDTVTSEATR
jgi:nitrate reductase assembly molybdenum cofactor insertion protein NarJ